MSTLTDLTQFVTFHSAAAQETATAQETAAAQPLSPSGVTTTPQTTTSSAVQPHPLRRCTEAERSAYRIISITDTDATVRKHGDSIILGYNGDVPHQPSTPDSANCWPARPTWLPLLLMTVPIVPFLLSYEGEVELKSRLGLDAAWQALVARPHRKG